MAKVKNGTSARKLADPFTVVKDTSTPSITGNQQSYHPISTGVSNVDTTDTQTVTDAGLLNYQTGMSNTAHQREVADLQKAGLNPILSANEGASTPSGSNAQTTAKAQMRNEMKIAKLQLKNAKQVAQINAKAQMYSADKSAEAQTYSADTSYKGTTYVADTNVNMTKLNNACTKWLAKYNGKINTNITELQTKAQKYCSLMSYKSAVTTAGAMIQSAQLGYDAQVYAVDNQNMGYSISAGKFSLSLTISRKQYDNMAESLQKMTEELYDKYGSNPSQKQGEELLKKYGWYQNKKGDWVHK